MDEQTIGANIRQLRLASQASLTEVAKRAGLTKSTLSKIETGQISSSISTLLSVASAMGVHLSDFVRENDTEKKYSLTRRGQGQSIVCDGTRFGYAYEALAIDFPDRVANPFLLTVRPGDKIGHFQHGGQEFVYVLEGEIEFTIGPDVFRMAPGDSLYFDPTQVHKTRLIGDTPARTLCCFIEKR